MVSVLNFFAAHPGQSFTFTDIVKALKLGRATCHALLAGLVEERYLYRNADKSYVIGPALAAIGKIVYEQFSPLQAAQPEMRILSDECHAVCAAVYYDRGNVVIRYRAGSGSHLGWSVPQGYEAPLRAPFAAAFFAWTEPDKLEKWLASKEPSLNKENRQALEDSIVFTRQHGYSFGVANSAVPSNFSEPEQAFSRLKSEYPILSLGTLEAEKEYNLSFISASVFNREGRVDFVLNLSGFTGTRTGADIERMGTLLRQAAERITYFSTGSANVYPAIGVDSVAGA